MTEKKSYNAKVTLTLQDNTIEKYYPRNIGAIKAGLISEIGESIAEATKIVLEFKDTKADTWVSIITVPAWSEFVDWADKTIIDFNTATTKLLQTCFYLMEVSDLKCGLITLGFSDAKITGLGIHSEDMPVEDSDVKGMLSGAQGQLDLFTEKISKLHPSLQRDAKLITLRNEIMDIVLKSQKSVIDGSDIQPDTKDVAADIKNAIDKCMTDNEISI